MKEQYSNVILKMWYWDWDEEYSISNVVLLNADDKLDECIRFGQFIFNTYDYEYENSYNVRSEIDAYNLILKGLMEEYNESNK